MDFEESKLVEMLRRSYFAADGLWFMVAEEMLGFDRALELDERVWQVMPKIQARKARELLGLHGSCLEELEHCLSLKFTAEGHAFGVAHSSPDRLEIAVTDCPWRNLLEKSKRLHLAETVAQSICVGEGKAWAAEFSDDISFELASSMCAGAQSCRFVFRRGASPATE
jgi:hypothetical protein